MNLTLTIIAISLATASISAYAGAPRVGPVGLLPPKHGFPFRFPELKKMVSDLCLPYANAPSAAFVNFMPVLDTDVADGKRATLVMARDAVFTFD